MQTFVKVAILLASLQGALGLPHWYYPAPASDSITVTGANGGYNSFGNGADGGSISIGRRAGEGEEAAEFFRRVYIPPYSQNDPIDVIDANGGTNVYGNGPEGPGISLNRRKEDLSPGPLIRILKKMKANGALQRHAQAQQASPISQPSVNRREEELRGPLRG